jgi:hypothetical protein
MKINSDAPWMLKQCNVDSLQNHCYDAFDSLQGERVTMSELTDVIRRAHSAKKQEVVASTIRLTLDEQAFIEEFAAQYSLTRQEAMRLLMRAGIEKASEEIEQLDEIEPLNRGAEIAEANGSPHFHVLNTNKRHSIESHQRMLKEGIAAAFYGEGKLNINRIRKNDVVFLYENGKGIVAYGKGTGETLIADYEGDVDEMHYQVLSDFTVLEEPLSAAEIRTILDRNVVFLRTMSGVPDGQKILNRISAQ